MTEPAPLHRTVSYGGEGCTCGTHATPAFDCVAHRPLAIAERITADMPVDQSVAQVEYREEMTLRVADAIARAMPTLNREEEQAMDHLLGYMTIVSHDWKLHEPQKAEMAAGVHVLQGYIVQHMMRRLAPGSWSSWYETQDPS